MGPCKCEAGVPGYGAGLPVCGGRRDLPRIALQGTKVTYDKGQIAEKLGVYSKSSGGKAPRAQAIGAIISELEIDPDEQESVPYSRNGHDGTDFQYVEKIINKESANEQRHC